MRYRSGLTFVLLVGCALCFLELLIADRSGASAAVRHHRNGETASSATAGTGQRDGS